MILHLYLYFCTLVIVGAMIDGAYEAWWIYHRLIQANPHLPKRTLIKEAVIYFTITFFMVIKFVAVVASVIYPLFYLQFQY